MGFVLDVLESTCCVLQTEDDIRKPDFPRTVDWFLLQTIYLSIYLLLQANRERRLIHALIGANNNALGHWKLVIKAQGTSCLFHLDVMSYRHRL